MIHFGFLKVQKLKIRNFIVKKKYQKMYRQKISLIREIDLTKSRDVSNKVI